MTTFSLRLAAKTMTSAISSGVRGSQPLTHNISASPRQGLFDEMNIRVNCISFGLVSVESNNREFLHKESVSQTGPEKLHPANEEGSYSFHLTRIDLDDSDASRDQFLSQRISEAPDRSLGSAVNTATGICFASRNAANVDDVSATALVSLLEDRQDCLGHVDQSSDIGREHNVDVFGVDIRSLRNTLDQPAVCSSAPQSHRM